MATTIGSFSHAYPISAFDTYNYTLQASGIHSLKVALNDYTNLTGVTIVVKQNGTTILSVPVAPSAAQLAFNVSVGFLGAVSDAISIQISSASSSDTGLNKIQGLITLTAGLNQF